jgi:hypothetical protein
MLILNNCGGKNRRNMIALRIKLEDSRNKIDTPRVIHQRFARIVPHFFFNHEKKVHALLAIYFLFT